MLNRGSTGCTVMGFEIEGIVVIRSRELVSCAGVAKLKLGSTRKIVEQRMYIVWKPGIELS